MRTANGSVISTRADGSRAEIRDAQRGLDIRYGLNGNRRVMTERIDHSRVFAERGGGGYVQHPYQFHGQELARRTYLEHGHESVRFYERYAYRGMYLEVYAPAHFYPVGFYGWVHAPWAAPVHYAWEWRRSVWYGRYAYYFTPYPVYTNASSWLTDYLIASSLQAAYAAQVRAQLAAGVNAPGLSPEVKEAIAEEVREEVQQETAAAQANAANSQGLPDNGGVGTLLGDGSSHVFVSGADIDALGPGGDECIVGPGDVVEVRAAPAYGAQSVGATVLASKGGRDCAVNSNIRIALADLQEMQNYMRETVDQGMADLQSRQGTSNLPAAPPGVQGAPVNAGFVTGAPPPDADAAAQIAAQASAADQAEKQGPD